MIFVLSSGYLPASINGANVSLHAQCRRMLADGFDPIVVCALDPAPRPRGAPALEYPVIRVADPVAAMIDTMYHLAPDAIVVRGIGAAAGAAKLAVARRYPLRIHIVRSPLGYALPPPGAAPLWRYAATSRYMQHLSQAYVGAPVDLVPTFIEPADYRCQPNGDAVLYVNPVPDKGVHIALAIARRLPHRRFLFVRSWPEHPDHPLVAPDLPNIEAVESVADMRVLYARTRIVLAPSVWEESFCRVVAEGQISGIPAVASDRGGLPEAVGPGGIVVSLGDPIERWCAAIESLFDDGAEYARLSRLAEAHAARAEMAPGAVMTAFARFIGVGGAMPRGPRSQ